MIFLKKHLRLIIISLVIATVTICCVVEPMLLIILIAIGTYGVCWYMDKRDQPAAIITEQMIFSVYSVAVRVLSKLDTQLQIEKPRTLSDVCGNPETVVKQGLSFVRTKVRLRIDYKDELVDKSAILRLIQNTLFSALRMGELDDLVVSRYGYNAQPIIIVENVFYEDSYLVIDWAVNNNAYIYDYICQRFNIRNNSSGANAKPSKDDEDF